MLTYLSNLKANPFYEELRIIDPGELSQVPFESLETIEQIYFQEDLVRLLNFICNLIELAWQLLLV